MISPEYFIMTHNHKTRAVTSIQNLFTYANYCFDIPQWETLVALNEMKNNNHNYAEFGVDKKFVYSKRVEAN